MSSCSRLFAAFLTLATTSIAATDSLPPLWPQDCTLPAWTNVAISWKATWNETLAANFDDKALRQTTRINQDPGKSPDLDKDGWITIWLVAGPFTMPGLGSKELFDVPFLPELNGNVAWHVETGPTVAKWRIQFRSISGDDRVAYMRSDVWAPKDMPARFEMGSNDGIKTWLNGIVVHANNMLRTCHDGQDTADVKLKQGWNSLLLKITQNKGPWEASLRIRAPDGGELKGLRVGTIEDTQQILRLRHILVLEAMIKHFPTDKDRHPQAYMDIAAEYANLDDRTRAIQWYAKLASDFPGRNDLVSSGCYEILRYSHPSDGIPDAMVWIDFASRKLLDLERSNGASLTPQVMESARRLPCLVMSSEQRYIQTRRFLESLRERYGRERWWLMESGDLLAKAGLYQKASRFYEDAGESLLATNILANVERGIADDTSAKPPHELEMRWKALQNRLSAAGTPVLMEPADLQELIRLSAESWSMYSTSPDNRSHFWALVDKALLAVKDPAALRPLSDLQEKKARAIAQELQRTYDADGTARLFRRYPWAHSAHEALLETGEEALLAGHNNGAIRCFQDVISHSADPALVAQAHAGLWITLAQLPGMRNDVLAAMAAVPDNTMIPWHGTNMPAGEVKAVVRSIGARDHREPVDPAAMKRHVFNLAREVAENNPGSPSRLLLPWTLGPWAVSRIDQANDLVSIVGHSNVSCFDRTSGRVLWSRCTPKTPYSEDGEVPPDPRERIVRNQACRPFSVNSPHSAAVAEYAGPAAPGTTSPRAIFTLVYAPGEINTAKYYIAAFDAGTGRPLWDTRGDPDWQEMSPMNSPTVSDGHLYVVSLGVEERMHHPLHIVCMDSDNGAVVWKRRMCAVQMPEKYDFELALAGSPVTVHQGSVYVSTDLGVAGRFDVRDGMADWVQAYGGTVDGVMLNLRFRREGSSPLVAGDKVIIAPRDHSGVLALDRASGRVMWEAPLVPSDRIACTLSNVVIMTADREVAALDLASGAELWHRELQGQGEAQVVVAGPDLLALSGTRIVRLSPLTGADLSGATLEKAPGADLVLLPDATLAEIGEERIPVSPEKTAPTAGSLRLPFTETWRLACDNPELTFPAPGNDPSDVFGVLSGRSVLCVRTKPQYGLAWKRRLRMYQDSLGIHGNLLLAARGGTLTSLDIANGATRWVVELPLRADIVCGNEQAVVVAQMSADGRLAALDPMTGTLLWSRWIGKDVMLNGKTLNWISMQKDQSGQSFLRLYLSETQAGKEGFQLAEIRMNPLTGLASELKPFIPSERGWPRIIAFGDDLRFTRNSANRPMPWPRQGPFLHDAVAYVGSGALAHFASRTPDADLAPGWTNLMNMAPDDQYLQTIGLHPTPAGSWIRRPGQLQLFDPAMTNAITYKLPTSVPTRTAYDIRDFRDGAGTVMVVSGSRTMGRENEFDRYIWNELRDCNGRGNVSLKCFMGQVRLGYSTRNLPEAGSNPVATLLNGMVKQLYQGSSIQMSGLASLGWSRYDVYFYGFTGTASIPGHEQEACSAPDYGNVTNRTRFVRGANYMKIAGVTGDVFTISFSECDFSALQVVNVSPNVSKSHPEGIGINWSGGGPALQPANVVGAEVPHGNWYNINQFNILFGGPPNTGSAANGMCVDVFDRATGGVLQTGALPAVRSEPGAFNYRSQARILDDAIITTDAGGIRVYRSGGK